MSDAPIRQRFWKAGPAPVIPANAPPAPPPHILKFPRMNRTRTLPENRPDMAGRPIIAGSVSRVGRLEVEASYSALFMWYDLEQMVLSRKNLWHFEVTDDDGRRHHEYVARASGDAWKHAEPDPNRPPTFGLVTDDDE